MFRLPCAASLKREVMFVLSMHGDLCEANKFTFKNLQLQNPIKPAIFCLQRFSQNWMSPWQRT